MKIFNSLTRKKEEFVPITKGEVTMYACGPTVYDYIHIGNARALVVFDAVRRYFLYKGYKVTFVQNFTDVDDKIIKRANEQNTTMDFIATKYIQEAIADMEGLNIKKPDHTPRVTEEMNEIIDMIQVLIDKGYAYLSAGNVYFSTKAFDQYGKLSKRNLEDLALGARVEISEDKKDKTDFVLWKPKKEGEPFWESPWGEGRPGWHIECSAMIKKYLGDTIDIHCGGEDLIFPHHENEIAQSQCANGKNFANYFMHNGFVNVDNEKMSKSQGNFFTLRDVVKNYDYMVVRFFLLSAHYKSPVNFTKELLDSAKSALSRIETCFKHLSFLEEKAVQGDKLENELLENVKDYKLQFERAMDDDFNTADAISSIFDLVRFINTNMDETTTKDLITQSKLIMEELWDVLGFKFIKEQTILDTKIEELIQKRQEAKLNKDFAMADKIRQELLDNGIVIEDTRAGVRWSFVK